MQNASLKPVPFFMPLSMVSPSRGSWNYMFDMQHSGVTGSVTHSDCRCVTRINTQLLQEILESHFGGIHLRPPAAQRQKTDRRREGTNLGPAVNGRPPVVPTPHLLSCIFAHLINISKHADFQHTVLETSILLIEHRRKP